MTPLEAAKQISEYEPTIYDAMGNYYYCRMCSNQLPGHEPDCAWIAMPRIVAALEAAEDLIEAATSGPHPVGGEGPMPFNEWRWFVRVMQGEGVTA